MTEPSAIPPRSNTNPVRPIFYQVLVLFVLLLAVILVYTLIFHPGLIPSSIWSATLTQTRVVWTETRVPETLGTEVASKERTFTPAVETPLTETPAFTEETTTATPSTSSLTPSFGACQYTLKSGPADYLYAIYWNWHINVNIPYLPNYYAGITCAALLTNLECNYQAARPNITQPGWILILPGVTSHTCLVHGGTPVQGSP